MALLGEIEGGEKGYEAKVCEKGEMSEGQIKKRWASLKDVRKERDE